MRELSQIRCFLLDMDGTFYLGGKVLPGALAFIDYLRASGREFLFLTNNSSKDALYYAEKLRGMGVACQPGDILTSGEATAIFLLREKRQPSVYLVGTPELERDFVSRGICLTDDTPDFAVLGFDMTLTYAKIEGLCRHVRAGVPFVATHPDFNCPTEKGYIPDCGSMIAMVRASTSVEPRVIGKPNREIIEMALAKRPYPAERVAIVGDRLYTDIASGVQAGINSILVLSGETKQADLDKSTIRPDFVFDGLGSLAEALRAGDGIGLGECSE